MIKFRLIFEHMVFQKENHEVPPYLNNLIAAPYLFHIMQGPAFSQKGVRASLDGFQLTKYWMLLDAQNFEWKENY